MSWGFILIIGLVVLATVVFCCFVDNAIEDALELGGRHKDEHEEHLGV